ncbi:DUF389 domain-containing protein [Terrabacter sp. NPDC000476]|uniref:DUF389 domain-containing protein n=1 Tax=Terrabacter sp. NPDC000476 TaxID=3154258 RepID=UPI00331CEC90
MLTAIRARVLPERQRRTFEELTADLDLNEGDTLSKRSAFWTMLVLAACIASAGIIADSTATVIGAMIIAPLSTPIMGTALALVKRERTGGVKFVVLGGLVVIALGALFSLLLPSPYDLLSNSQVAARTSPRLVDLLGALATGFAGAIALARRDVAAILPGVAISISLVPPLCVVGICLAEGSPSLAFGALVLFLSNFLALVFAGSLVFTTLGYTSAVREQGGRARHRVRVTFALLVLLVLVPVVLNSLVALAVAKLTDVGRASARSWLASTPGAEVVDVTNQGFSLVIEVRAPTDLPPTATLMSDLSTQLPTGIPVVLERSVGESLDLGSTT